jgi:DNA processing protein
VTITQRSDDSLAIALLCSRLAMSERDADAVKPLTLAEWNPLSQRLAASSFGRPRALLGRTSDELRSGLELDEQEAERLVRLLDRAGLATLELERFAHRGLWMLTRIDDGYPRRWKERLTSQAPPVIFGAGDVALLDGHGVAVVGSRDVDELGAEFAATLGRRCAAEGLTVVSGGARGVDRIAMNGALEDGGVAVGVLGDSLDRLARSADSRRFVRDGRLAFVSPFHPSAGFQVGNAMARNKLIYALADYAVVVATSHASGGTWHGAVEQLKYGWTPLFVRVGDGAPAGNLALVDEGGKPVEEIPPVGQLADWLRARASAQSVSPVQPRVAQLALLTGD